MATTDPIRNEEDVRAMFVYCWDRGKFRDGCLIAVGLYTGLRAGDLLRLKWGDLYDFERERFYGHVPVKEKKTGKGKRVLLHRHAAHVLDIYKASLTGVSPQTYIFKSQKGRNIPLSRQQAYRIVRGVSQKTGVEGVIGCHSLRKTLGSSANRKGVSLAAIMQLYNHTSFSVTLRYIGVVQDDIDRVYECMDFLAGMV